MSITIQNSDLKGLKILYVAPSNGREDFETLAELDSDLRRVQFYSADNLSEARRIAGDHEPQLIIFQAPLENRDFVSIHIELRNASPKSQTTPLISEITISQLREVNALEGIFDWADLTAINDFSKIKEVIFAFARSQSNSAQDDQESKLVATIQRTLLISHPEMTRVKEASARVLLPLTNLYDLSPAEVQTLFTAEKIYLPQLSTTSYSFVLSEGHHELLNLLQSTGSWIPERRPSTAEGFLITCANYAAAQLEATEDLEAIASSILSRPSFLKHVAIRSLTSTAIIEALTHACGTRVTAAAG